MGTHLHSLAVLPTFQHCLKLLVWWDVRSQTGQSVRKFVHRPHNVRSAAARHIEAFQNDSTSNFFDHSPTTSNSSFGEKKGRGRKRGRGGKKGGRQRGRKRGKIKGVEKKGWMDGFTATGTPTMCERTRLTYLYTTDRCNSCSHWDSDRELGVIAR